MSALATTPPYLQTTLNLQPSLTLDTHDLTFLTCLWAKALPSMVQQAQPITLPCLHAALQALNHEAPKLIQQLLAPAKLKHLAYLWQHLGWLAYIEPATKPEHGTWLPTAKGWCVGQRHQAPSCLASLPLPPALSLFASAPSGVSDGNSSPLPLYPEPTFSCKAQAKLYHALAQCRNLLAHHKGVTPTQICSQSVLVAMAQAHPLSESSLASLQGIDDHFIQNYAPAFLDTLIPLALRP